MISIREQLLAESKGVKSSVKWLKKRIKEKKKNEIYDFYSHDRAIINELNEIRVSLEKYAKKLQHQANEELRAFVLEEEEV